MPKLDAPPSQSVTPVAPAFGRNVDQSRPLRSLLNALKGQANAALDDDAVMNKEVEHARRVLTRAAEMANGALERLSRAEEELEEKWAALVNLLSEVRQLEIERHEALQLAQRLSAVQELEEDEIPVEEEQHFAEYEHSAYAAHFAEVECAEDSEVRDLRATLNRVVQAIPSYRASR